MRFLFKLLSSKPKQEEQSLMIELKNITGLNPRNIDLYKLALRHRSADKYKNNSLNNERLEFLGDAILGAVVADYLYEQYPNKDEGFLTSMRSKIVSRTNLNNIANIINLNRLIISNLDKRKKANSISGDALEAIVGAVYLDHGISGASEFVRKIILKKHLDIHSIEKQILSYKSKFIEWAQKERISFEFVLLDSWGLDHNKTFQIGIMIDRALISSGTGGSKKIAEEVAAFSAFQKMNIVL